MSAVQEALEKEVSKTLKPKERMTLSEWADTYRVLSPEASAEPGQWETARAPFQKEIMDTISNPDYERIVVVGPTQMIKTECCILNPAGYFIHQDPSPILLIRPTLEDAKDFSKERLAPMIRDTPVLAEAVDAPKSRDSDNTTLHKKFKGGYIALVGANSADKLASRPIRVLLFDEVDSYPESAGKEGDPISIAEKRTTTFWNRKIVITSSIKKPEGESRILFEYKKSDQRECHVPCPHCGLHQYLEFENLKFERDEKGKLDRDSVKFECIGCNERIDESYKFEMLEKHKWIAQAESEIAGFLINEFYSPWKNWYEIVEQFLKVKDDPEKLKVLINTSFVKAFKQRGVAPEWEVVYGKREFYKRNIVPKGGLVLVAGTDVQRDRFETEIKAFGRNMESWSVDYRITYCDPGNLDSYRELDKILEEKFETEYGQPMKITTMGIDSGGFALDKHNTHTAQVYQWARMRGVQRVMALKGAGNIHTLLAVPNLIDFDYNMKKVKKGVHLWRVGSGIAKFNIYANLRLKLPEKGQPFPPNFMHFPDYEDWYFKQLTAQSYIREGGKWGWVLPAGMSKEVLDANVYCFAVASRLRLEFFTETKWQSIERQYTSVKKPAAKKRHRKNVYRGIND